MRDDKNGLTCCINVDFYDYNDNEVFREIIFTSCIKIEISNREIFLECMNDSFGVEILDLDIIEGESTLREVNWLLQAGRHPKGNEIREVFNLNIVATNVDIHSVPSKESDDEG